ncbi:MAG: hypothetical protein CML07_01250 [Psychrobacter sp.]|nr:hypothetical protein [Psychrobacter sp.]
MRKVGALVTYPSITHTITTEVADDATPEAIDQHITDQAAMIMADTYLKPEVEPLILVGKDDWYTAEAFKETFGKEI